MANWLDLLNAKTTDTTLTTQVQNPSVTTTTTTPTVVTTEAGSQATGQVQTEDFSKDLLGASTAAPLVALVSPSLIGSVGTEGIMDATARHAVEIGALNLESTSRSAGSSVKNWRTRWNAAVATA